MSESSQNDELVLFLYHQQRFHTLDEITRNRIWSTPPAVPHSCFLLLSIQTTSFYLSPLNALSAHCDGQTDEGGGGGKWSLAQVSFFHLLFSVTTLQPCLTPALSLILLLPLSCPLSPLCPQPLLLCPPDWLCTGMGKQREREREIEDVTGPPPSVETAGSNNRILSENRR